MNTPRSTPQPPAHRQPHPLPLRRLFLTPSSQMKGLFPPTLRKQGTNASQPRIKGIVFPHHHAMTCPLAYQLFLKEMRSKRRSPGRWADPIGAKREPGPHKQAPWKGQGRGAGPEGSCGQCPCMLHWRNCFAQESEAHSWFPESDNPWSFTRSESKGCSNTRIRRFLLGA